MFIFLYKSLLCFAYYFANNTITSNLDRKFIIIIIIIIICLLSFGCLFNITLIVLIIIIFISFFNKILIFNKKKNKSLKLT